MNLFSIFDPVSGGLVDNWSSVFWVFMFINLGVWVRPSSVDLVKLSVVSSLVKELSSVLGSSLKHSVLLFSAIFSFIVSSNVLGLLSYNFTPSSHMVFSLSLALSIWLSFTVFSVVFKTGHMLAHLVPLGTPTVLIPFMVLIESISSLIRPLTLAIRLSANMVAGHLLLALLGGYGSVFSSFLGWTVISTSWILLTLEIAVALIQGYVFIVLLSLYLKEV